MSEELEHKLLREIEELKRELAKLKGEEISQIPTYQFSGLREKDLLEIVQIEESFEDKVFHDWFHSSITIDKEAINYLAKLLEREGKYIKYYNEENLKIKFIVPILNLVDFFISDNVKDFYEEVITYKTDKFILTGIVDFLVSKGVKRAEKPYFFIQEFKRGKENSDPEPQLLAELISAVELNHFTSLKGAFVIGSIWNFAILEKLGEHKYQYFISENFDSTKIEDLKAIYKNLLFVKEEIIKIVESETRGVLRC
ncbi:MAG: hypothetical protein KDK90_05325 [Leptospiraceae bacterium]|nr:hypothetical protein [Leptospiraceae bacterium]